MIEQNWIAIEESLDCCLRGFVLDLQASTRPPRPIEFYKYHLADLISFAKGYGSGSVRELDSTRLGEFLTD